MWFYFVVLLDSVFLQPIRCILGFLMRFLWRPPVVLPVSTTGYTLSDLCALAYERLATLDRTIYGQDPDSAKFLGMLYYATGNEADWRGVMRLVQDDGTIRRSLADPYPEDAVSFSADMLSGLILAVTKRLPRLTDAERAKLAALWDRTTWQGFPLLFADAGSGKKAVFGRGHVWRPWWLFGSEDALTALVWLDLGWRITGQRRYRVAARVFKVLQWPGLRIACPDAQIWLGPVYGIAPYNTHSRVLIYYAGWRLSGDVLLRHALAQAYTRHGVYNADIRILAGAALGIVAGSATRAMLGAVANKGAYPCPQNARYLSLFWPPERVMRSRTILSPEFRGGDYVWERNPVKGAQLDADYRARKGLDLIFPVLVLAGLSAAEADAS